MVIQLSIIKYLKIKQLEVYLTNMSEFQDQNIEQKMQVSGHLQHDVTFVKLKNTNTNKIFQELRKGGRNRKLYML